MDNLSFTREFFFTQYERKNDYHSDIRTGAPMHFFGYILNGHAHFESETESFDIKEGELVYIPNHLPYHSYWYGSPTVRFISLGFGCFPDTSAKRYRLQKIELDEKVETLIRAVPLNTKIGCKEVAALYALLDRLLPHMTYTVKKPTDGIVDKARRIMKSEPSLSIGEVAKRCGVSESGLYAAFRKTGTTPVDARQQMLCERAVTLLISTNMTVEYISDTLGFSTPAYFRRVLKKHFGKTPKEIRKSLPV
ncbi:MAG: AraC family transcriptional regulator [Acutalibacteraceae bacterium]|nr:AraC family transcriptional regulator [Acutalibacteraceae bacterium]